MASLVRCIYCPNEFDPAKGEGEHVVPDAFGKFEGAFIFRGMCPKCNFDTSKCDEQLLRVGPAAPIRRQLVGQKAAGKRGKRRGTKCNGAGGFRPPEFEITFQGHKLAVSPSSQKLGHVELSDRLLVQMKDGSVRQIEFHPLTTTERFVELVGVGNVQNIAGTKLRWGSPAQENHRRVMLELFPLSEFGDVSLQSLANAKSDIHVTAIISPDFVRGMAKIAFHYYLLTSHLGWKGNEDVFASLREFIRGGTSGINYAIADWSEIGVIPANVGKYQHLLASMELRDSIQIVVGLCFGPSTPLHPLVFGINGVFTGVTCRARRWAHAYMYELTRSDSLSGTVREVMPLDNSVYGDVWTAAITSIVRQRTSKGIHALSPPYDATGWR